MRVFDPPTFRVNSYDDDFWGTVEVLVEWLDEQDSNIDHVRILKVQEEAGEVAQAWIGYLGQNPRKGFTHTLEDVAYELVDVMLTAAVAIRSLGFADGPDLVVERLRVLRSRILKDQ